MSRFDAESGLKKMFEKRAQCPTEKRYLVMSTVKDEKQRDRIIIVTVTSAHKGADFQRIAKFMQSRKFSRNPYSNKDPKHGFATVRLSKLNRFAIQGTMKELRDRRIHIRQWDRNLLNSKHLRKYGNDLRYSSTQEFETREISDMASLKLAQYLDVGFQRTTLRRKADGYLTLRSMSDVYLLTGGVIIEDDPPPDKIIASSRFIKAVLDIAVIHMRVRLHSHSKHWAECLLKARGSGSGFLLDAPLLVQHSDYDREEFISLLGSKDMKCKIYCRRPKKEKKATKAEHVAQA